MDWVPGSQFCARSDMFGPAPTSANVGALDPCEIPQTLIRVSSSSSVRGFLISNGISDPMPSMLTQLITVKARLSILDSDTSQDPLLTNALKAVSARFDKETNRTLGVEYKQFSLLPLLPDVSKTLQHYVRWAI